MRTLLNAALVAVALAIGAVSPAFAQGRIIIFNGNEPGVGLNDPTPVTPIGGNTATTLGEQRLNVLRFAADIWTAVLDPRVDIYVWTAFTPQNVAVLATAEPISVSRDFPGAEIPGVWYHEALANHLRGFDPTPGPDPTGRTSEISLFVNRLSPFYLGLDNNEESVPGSHDLLVVALHELGHGLGFGTFINGLTGAPLRGFGDLYAEYMLDLVTGKNWNDMTNSERAASARNVRKVAWAGINVSKEVPNVLRLGEPVLRANSPGKLGSFLVGEAKFGPRLTAQGVTADLALAGLPPLVADGCTPLSNDVAGKIVLLDRLGGCTLQQKVKNAQIARAVAALLISERAGAPPLDFDGADPTIIIPHVTITQADGQTLKDALASGEAVNLTLGLDTSIRAGADPIKDMALLSLFTSLLNQGDLPLSHFDHVAAPNQLMESFLNTDLTTSVTAPEDLSAALFTDLGWFSDRDGVPDGKDSCIGSDTRQTVVLGQCDSRAVNDIMGDGCSVSDQLGECSGSQGTAYAACIAEKAAGFVSAGILTAPEEEAIVLCASQ